MGIAPYEPDWGTRQNMLEGGGAGGGAPGGGGGHPKNCGGGAPAGARPPFLLLWDILFFDVPPEKRGNLRPGKRRLGIQVLAIIAL